MAKNVYIGVNNIAKAIKKIYIGIDQEEPVYNFVENRTAQITNSNLTDFFTISTGQYSFVGTGSSFTSNNTGISYSEAKLILTALYEMNISFDYSYSTEEGWDFFNIIANNENILSDASGEGSGQLTINLLRNQKIIFSYAKDSTSGEGEGDDSCTISNIVINYKYDEIIGTTIKHDICKKIKKAYIGVGGIARPFWSQFDIEYFGTIDNISGSGGGRWGSTAVNFNDKLLFGAGKDADDYTALVDAYDASLTKTTLPNLGKAVINIGGASVENYAIFTGGYNGTTRYNNVYSYNKSFTRATAASLEERKTLVCGLSFKGYALFGGGLCNDGTDSSKVECYNNSLTKTLLTDLDSGAKDMTSANLENIGVFCSRTLLEGYDSSLTKLPSINMQYRRIYHQIVAINNHFAIIGGDNISSIEIYDSSLTLVGQANLEETRAEFGAEVLGDYIIVTKGRTETIDDVYSTEIYDKDFTRISSNIDSKIRKQSITSGVIGNYALFMGGYGSTNFPPGEAYILI